MLFLLFHVISMKHLLSCLHPVRIPDINGRPQYVPCGKCDACRSMQSSVWIQRLEQESRCWKHTLFFTLTYSDDFLPKLERLDESIWCDRSRVHHGDSFPFVSLNDFVKASVKGLSDPNHIAFTESDTVRQLENKEFIPYLPVSDIQKFIKRLRSNLVRKYDKNEKTNKIRYYIVGEYGPKHLRPHWHGILWTNSDELCSNVSVLLHSSWKFGYIDCSPVENSASAYVAKYLNCFTHLPPFYKEPTLRPFALFSKCPPLGSLSVPTSQVRKMFFSASPKFALRDSVKSSFALVNLWNFYKNRLFPKIKAFNKFNHRERVALYRFIESFPYSPSVSDAQVLTDWYYTGSDVSSLLGSSLSPLVRDYIAHLCDCSRPVMSVYRWLLISGRVVNQACQFGVSVSDYVRQIELFYDRCEKAALKSQLQFEDEYTRDRPVCELIGLDLEFFNHFCNIPKSLVTPSEMTLLESYGIDLDKFFSDNTQERLLYIRSVNPYLTKDYTEFYQDSLIFYKHSVRTREKNEFDNPALAFGLQDGNLSYNLI